MDTKYKVLIGVIIVIGVILLINEFVLFSIFPSYYSSSSSPCISPILSPSIERSELILTGTAGTSKWIKNPKREIETHTAIKIDDVIMGEYNNNKIIVKQWGGCNVRLNRCGWSDGLIKFEKGDKYLLFLSDPNEDGVYDVDSGCGQSSEITLDDFGNEKVWCFADEIIDCIEKEIACPKKSPTEDKAPDMVDSEGNIIPQPERKCYERYVLLEDLIKQIKEDQEYCVGDDCDIPPDT